MVALCGVWLGASAAPGRAAVAVSPTLRADDEFCLGCHDERSHAKETPSVDRTALLQSAHRNVKCAECHVDVTAIPHRAPLARVDCTRCHSADKGEAALKAQTGGEAPLDVHSKARHRGAKGLPVCTDCHGAHGTGRISEARAQVGREEIAATCGACHAVIAADYAGSVHGTAARAGNPDVPTCDVCHPEHARLDRETVQERGVVATCASCHDDPGLQAKYAIPGGRLASYLGSYHGAATELGDSRTANCASCHGIHDVLPSDDERSRVNRANLPRTCGGCHPNAGEHFAEGKIHLEPTFTQDRIVFFVRTGYLLFILGLMSSFLGYIGLDLLARVRRRYGARHPLGTEEGAGPEFERLTLNQRLQHWLLIASFTTLIVSGLPLASPTSALSHQVITFLGGMGARSVIHRVAAIVLIGVCCYHLLYVLFSRRGYWEFRQLIPGLQDGKDVIQILKFYLGLTPARPRFGRYNFIEKFEYLAVGWGSVVMIGTGVLLWSPHLSMMLLPKWMMDIAFAVHSWEAILAFLAIIIWHMYNVHVNPAVFPMSRVWLTGKISLHELVENHPLEYEQLLRRQRGGASEEEQDTA